MYWSFADLEGKKLPVYLYQKNINRKKNRGRKPRVLMNFYHLILNISFENF